MSEREYDELTNDQTSPLFFLQFFPQILKLVLELLAGKFDVKDVDFFIRSRWLRLTPENVHKIVLDRLELFTTFLLNFFGKLT